MAFFGLTALGLQNPFSVSADTINHFIIFTDADFKGAYERQKAKQSADGFSVSIDQVSKLPGSLR
jgi:5S rRNA maturation endonuclease (ribonuclease M5)